MKHFAALVAVVGIMTVGAGCATLPRDGGVAVSLVSIVPQQSSLFETSAQLTLRYTNETARPLEFTGSTHRLFVNGTYVGRAVTNERVGVRELGTTTQTITAHLENLALMRKAQELGNVTTVDYRIESQLFTHDARGNTLGAVATGQLDLSGWFNSAPATRGE
jgi:hypothetical protein